MIFIVCCFYCIFFKFYTAKTASVVSGVVSSLVIIILLVIAIVIAVVCVKRNRHKEQSSDNCNVEIDLHSHHPTTSTKFSQDTTSSKIYNSCYGIPEQTTLLQSVSKTTVYDNLITDNDPTSSEQKIYYIHPFKNISYGVQPTGPNITVSQSPFYPHNTRRK